MRGRKISCPVSETQHIMSVLHGRSGEAGGLIGVARQQQVKPGFAWRTIMSVLRADHFGVSFKTPPAALSVQ